MANDENNDGVPHSNPEQFGTAALVWLLLAGVIATLLYLSYVFSTKDKTKKKKERNAPNAAAGENIAQNRPAVAVVAGGARRPRRMRVRNRDDSDSDNGEFGNDENDLDAPFDDDQIDASKLGTKKARKLELKAEKKAQREAELEEREERKRREALLETERKKDDVRRKFEADEREEEERLRKEEKERKEYEEYLQIKSSFVVEESGEVGILTEEESQSLLQEFIDYIKNSKVVQLEDLGTKFNLKTQEAIESLEHLLEIGRLTGVMDDRGKFIYISEDELEQVAKFIKQRGRTSIAELAESSNALINMDSCKEQAVSV